MQTKNNKIELIKDLYFNKNLSQNEIAQQVSVCKQYVSKVLLSDARYLSEKEERKTHNKKQNITKTKEYIRQKRETESTLNAYMQQQHIQAMMELSGGHSINNRAFRRWNASVYSYNNKKRAFILKRGITAGYSTPKIIN